MKVVFVKTSLETAYEKLMERLNEHGKNDVSCIDYVILSREEFNACVVDIPVKDLIGVDLAGDNVYVSKVFSYNGVWFIEQIPLDYAYHGMYGQTVQQAKICYSDGETLND